MNTHTITTGSRNSVSSVENAIANVLLKASGLNSRPSRSPRKKIGRNDVTMISIENSSGRVIVAVARTIVRIFSAGRDVAAPGQLRRAVLDDDDGGVGHLADRDGQPGEREQVDRLAERRQRQRREQRAEQQHADRRDRRPDVPQRDAR